MSNDYIPGLGLIPLILPGLALLIAVRMLYVRQRYSKPGLLYTLLIISGWMLISLSIIGGVVALTGGFSLLFAVIWLVVFVMALRRLIVSERRSLLAAMTVAVDRHIPLPEAARAYADEHGPWLRLRATRLAERLEAGSSLAQAIRESRLRLPSPAMLAINMNEHKGDLAAALRQSSADLDRFDSLLRPAIVKLIILLLVVVYVFGIVTFHMIFIVPVFAKMFREFEIDLPTLTVVTIELANGAVRFSPLIYGVIIPTMVLALLYYVDLLPGDLPLVGRFWRPIDRASTLRMLAWSTGAGLPLAETVRRMAELHPRRHFRRLLARCAAKIDQGANWCEVLRRERLLRRADVAVLQAAERTGNLAWALSETAEASLRRTAHRLRAAIAIVFPIVILLIGLFTGLIVVGMMEPLVTLIEKLS
jgi:type IV pilus assembly protein PilC